MSGSALFVQPPGSVPIPMLADLDGQCYYASGGISRFVTVAPASVAGGNYTSGQTIGSVMTIAGAARAVGNGSGVIYGATIIDPNRNVGQVDLLYFNSSPSNSIFTDKTEGVLSALDISKLVGSSHITDWTIYGATTGCSVGNNLNAGMVYSLGKTGSVVNTSLFAVAIARTTITLPISGPLWSVNFKILPD